jgi:hypothetical protein
MLMRRLLIFQLVIDEIESERFDVTVWSLAKSLADLFADSSLPLSLTM